MASLFLPGATTLLSGSERTQYVSDIVSRAACRCEPTFPFNSRAEQLEIEIALVATREEMPQDAL